MKPPLFWIIVIIIAVAGLFIISRILAPKPVERTVGLEATGASWATGASGALPEGWQKIDGGDFTITAPESWSVTKDSSGAQLLSLASADTTEIFENSDEIFISFAEFPKNEKPTEQSSKEKITLDNGTKATKNISQDNTQTLTKYFIESGQTIFLVSVLTRTNEKTETLNLVAEQIVKSFEIK